MTVYGPKRDYGRLPVQIGTYIHSADSRFIVLACNSHDALTADNARLRKALRQIVAVTSPRETDYPDENRGRIIGCDNIARAALKE
jgi:hypothetical protein